MFLKETGINRNIVTGNLDLLTKSCEATLTAEKLPELTKKKLMQEVKNYFETGNCNLKKKSKNAAINPTLLEPKTLLWRVDGSSCPFNGYCPMSFGDSEAVEEGMANRFCQKKLKILLTAFRQMERKVRFYFHFGEDMHFCHVGTFEKFDVIESSSLADDIGLANVVSSTNQRLKPCSDALLLTESFLWSYVASSGVEYVEESLCAPLSMIPTLYGFILNEHAQTSPSPATRNNGKSGLVLNLTWQKAPGFENVPLGCSPSLERCLKKLEKKCYFMEGSSNSWLEKKVSVLNKWLSPLTLDGVITRLAEQAGKQEKNYRKKFFDSTLPRQFSLAQTTLDAWANRNPVVVLTGAQMFSPVLARLFNEQKLTHQCPTLRLVLAPFTHYVQRTRKFRQNIGLPNNWTPKVEADLRKAAGLPDSFSFNKEFSQSSEPGQSINWATEIPQVHYIDNFFLNFVENEDGSFHSVQIAFLLPKEHGLTATHSAALVEMATGMQMIFVGFLKDLRQTDMDESQITVKRFCPPSQVNTIGPHMRAVTCQESETEFAVEISIQTKDDPQGNYKFL